MQRGEPIPLVCARRIHNCRENNIQTIDGCWRQSQKRVVQPSSKFAPHLHDVVDQSVIASILGTITLSPPLFNHPLPSHGILKTK